MNPILLQAAGAESSWMSFLPIIAIVVVFYFFMIRPQQKRQKEVEQKRNALKAGDRVVTSGGIYGTIKHVNERDFVIEIADNVRVSIDKNSVFATEDSSKK